MGTHGRGRFARLLVGSVGDAVLRNSQVPVLLVPRNGRRFKMRTLLIPLDGTPATERVLEDAVLIAQLFGSKITLLHAIESEHAARRDPADRPLPLAHEEFVLRSARSEEYLDRVAEPLRQAGIDVETVTLAGEQLQRVVARAADSVHADMIGLVPKTVDPRTRLVRAGVLDHLLKGTDTALLLRPPTKSSALLRRAL
jgi:nucleotide-binding universal stress UspA family protein